jgi:hypothetical protein
MSESSGLINCRRPPWGHTIKDSDEYNVRKYQHWKDTKYAHMTGRLKWPWRSHKHSVHQENANAPKLLLATPGSSWSTPEEVACSWSPGARAGFADVPELSSSTIGNWTAQFEEF